MEERAQIQLVHQIFLRAKFKMGGKLSGEKISGENIARDKSQKKIHQRDSRLLIRCVSVKH